MSVQEEPPKALNQATRIVTLVRESEARFFVDSQGNVLVDIEGVGQEVVPLSHNRMVGWLNELLFEAEGLIPGHGAVSQAVAVLEAMSVKEAGPVPQAIIDRMAANVAIERELQGNASQRRSHATRLVEYAIARGIELFHDKRGEPYCVLPLDRREIWPVPSRVVRRWLAHVLWEEEGIATSGDSISSGINLLSSMALFEGEEHELHVRVAWHNGDLYYDLGDCRAVRISNAGWEVVDQPPILFRRYSHQIVQVEPRQGGRFERLFDFISPTRTDDDALLMGVTMLAYMLPGSPRPAISFAGPQGSGKSTTAKMIKRIVDPSGAQSVRRIADFRELQLQLEQNHLLNLDNITNLPSEISDGLAAAITGDSDLRRQLYSDTDMILLQYMRPMILNGITHAAQKPDLLDRTILITLGRIPEDRRRGEEQLWPEFELALPDILGGAFEILSKAIALRPHIKLLTMPRMADAAVWGYAIAEAAEWGGPKFLAAYEHNIGRQHEEVVAASAVAQAITVLMEYRETWEGPASALKMALDPVAEGQGIDLKSRQSGWPGNASRLSKEVRRLAETLEATGIEVSYGFQGNARSIRLRKISTRLEDETNVAAVGTVGGATRPTGRKASATDGKDIAIPFYTDTTDGDDGKTRPCSGDDVLEI